MYLEIRPAKRIDNLVDSFWTFSNNTEHTCFKVLPDTCTDLIFDLNQSNWFISGVMANYQLRELPTGSNLIGARFKSEKFGCLANLPLNETKNLRVELSEILAPSAINALKPLTDLESSNEKIYFLEDFIETSFQKNLLNHDKMVVSVAQNIRALHGVVNVKDLAKSHHICLRQLERRFKSYIGLTIKEFSNIVRFHHAKTSISALTKTSLLEIAFDFGYYDHSHMTNEFKRISGENPSFFR